MIEDLFASLSHALGSSPLIAMGAAFVWGLLSVVLSPCHLASIPLVVAFVGQQERSGPRRALAISSVFALGILATIAAIGVVTAALGRMLGDVGSYAYYAIALIFFLLGLHFLGVVPLPWSRPGPRGAGGRGLGAALLLGLLFGIGVGPCTFAYMAPMLAAAFGVAASDAVLGGSLLLLYGLGHCSVIVAAGASADRVQRYLDWNARSRGATRLRQACGVLVILGGIYLLYTAP